MIASRQSESYKKNRAELSEDTILIDIDWKQKVLIGKIS